MEENWFVCRTRGGFSSAGLPKILISCHPQDASLLSAVAEDVLEAANCVVCFLREEFAESKAAEKEIGESEAEGKKIGESEAADEGSAESEASGGEPSGVEETMEDLELQLAEMNLFVFLVTSRFLLEPCFPKERLYGFAMKKHIPILPICLEAGLEKMFARQMNGICPGYGEIQVLNRRPADPTELPYPEKLRRNLYRILPAEEDYKKMEEAFSARIFLSYRKKDRKYALRMMKNIHRIPEFCRFSIWYDEFLNIGERWSAEILDRIRSCDLFLLLVTPSLLEAGNYCEIHEYPAAKEWKLPVLPVQMVRMDRGQMQEFHKKFPEAGDAVDGRNSGALEEALRSYLPCEEPSPESGFYMGLAFLNGVGVERNAEIAVRLISFAAGSGAPAAMDKLSDMYWSGEGVSVDYRKAVSWMEKAAAAWRYVYGEERNQENGLRLYAAMVRWIEAMRDIGDFTGAYREVRRLTALAETFYGLFDSLQADECLAIACDLAGQIRVRQEEYDSAFRYFQKECDLRESICRRESGGSAREDLTAAYEQLGLLAYRTRNYGEARTWYDKALEIREALNGQSETKESAFGLARIDTELGDLYLRTDETQKAEESYMRAKQLMERVLCAENTLEYQSYYASVLTALGDAEWMRGCPAQAEEYFRRGLDICRRAAEERKTLEAQRDLSVSLNRMGRLEADRKEYRKSAEFFRESLEIRRELLDKRKDDGARYDCAVVLWQLGEVCEQGIDRRQAVSCYREAAELLRPVLAEDRTLNPHYIYAVCCFKVFSSDTFHGKPYLVQAVESMRWLTLRAPGDAVYQKVYRRYREIYQRCYPESV